VFAWLELSARSNSSRGDVFIDTDRDCQSDPPAGGCWRKTRCSESSATHSLCPAKLPRLSRYVSINLSRGSFLQRNYSVVANQWPFELSIVPEWSWLDMVPESLFPLSGLSFFSIDACIWDFFARVGSHSSQLEMKSPIRRHVADGPVLLARWRAASCKNSVICGSRTNLYYQP